MSYDLHPNSSLEWLILYTGTRVALFKAEDAPPGLAEPWEEMLTKLRQARDARDDARISTAAARATVKIRDVRWEKTVHDLAGVALSESNRDPKKPPYKLLFGTVSASRAKKLGLAKALSFGKGLVAALKALAHPVLTPRAAEVEQRNEALLAADALRLDATIQERTHDIARLQLIDEVERQIALTELELLKLDPGNDDLVAAYLSPNARAVPADHGVAFDDDEPGADAA